MKKVLVAGATGYLGQYLVKELKNKGYWVRVLIRDEKQKEKFTDVDDYFVGAVTNSKSIEGVTKGIDWVFSTIGITRQKDGLTYMDVDYQGNANLLTDALSNRVEVFQYISAINGDKLRHLKIFEAKEKFVDELKSSGLKYSIIRPCGFFSDMNDFLEMAKGGKVFLFGNGKLKMNPIDGKDLANSCVKLMEEGVSEATVGGLEILTQNEIATLALKAWQKPTKIIHFPDWTRMFTIWILRIFTSSKTYGPFEFFLTAMALDSVATQYGESKLEDFFNSEVQKSKRL